MNEKKKQKYLTTVKDSFQKIAYAVVYPFWPREMRELIKKYEAEGTLNLKGVYFLATGFFATNLFFFTIFLLFLTQKNSITETIVMALIGIVFPIYLLLAVPKPSFRRLFAPYSYGKPTKIVVKKISYWHRRIVKINYTNKETNKNLTGNYSSKVWQREDYPEVGDEITAYVTNSDKYGVMPDIQHSKQLFSLTTTIIQ